MMYKRFSLVSLLAAAMIFVAAGMALAEDTSGYFTYKINNGESTITDYSKNGPKDVVIPNILGGCPITGIGEYAFCQMNIRSVTIPSTVRNIGSSAFSGNSISSVVIPEGVTTIADFAFCQSQINNLTLPNSLQSIGSSSFSGNNITKLKIPEAVTNISNYSFAQNQINSLTLPDNVNNIGSSAFSQNNLTYLSIPNSVKSIGDFAFCQNKISCVVIPDSVKSIGNYGLEDNQQNPKDLTIYGSKGTIAEQYANSKKHTFIEYTNDMKIMAIQIEGQGNVNPGAGIHYYSPGSEVSLTAAPAANYSFDGWTINGNTVHDTGTKVTIEGDTTVIAHFIRIKPASFNGYVAYSNNSKSTPEGTISVIIDGQTKASKSFKNGKFGIAPDAPLAVEYTDIINGQKIEFQVNGVYAKPLQTIHWSNSSGILQTISLTTEYCFFNYSGLPSGKEVQIDKYSPDGPKDVVIPSKLGGYPVTCINAWRRDCFDTVPKGAFENLGLTSVVIPDTVTYIHDCAFSWNKIKSVYIPPSVTYVGQAAFWGNVGTGTAGADPKKFTIYGAKGSAAEEYAKSYGNTFIVK